MDKSDVTVPLNVLDRRKLSETNHIIRIRTAYASREFRPWGIFQEKKGFPLIPESKGKRRFSLDSELTRRFQFPSSQDFNETVRTLKSLRLSRSDLFPQLDTEEKMKLKKPVLTRSKIKSAKTANTRTVKSFKKETPGKQKKNMSKLNPAKSKTFTTAQKAKTSKLRDNKGLRTTKSNSRRIKQEKVSSVQQSKSTEKDLTTLVQWLQENIETLERPITPKDLILLKWLDGLKIPETGKENVQKNSYERTETYPIQVLSGSLKPFPERLMLNVPVKSRYKEPSKRSSSLPQKILSSEKSKKQRFTKDDPEVGDRHNYKESPHKNTLHKLDYSKSAELAQEKGEQENTYIEKGTSEEFESTDSTSLFNKTEGICPDAEMRITELGKLQIVLSLNSFKPDDVAVIIWLNEIPKSHMKPDYRKRLSITSLNEIQPPEKPTVLRSISSPELEDVASPKPQIYFPPVTILKNLSVDSKGELRNLKEASSAVFYKRCNLIHVDSLHS